MGRVLPYFPSHAVSHDLPNKVGPVKGRYYMFISAACADLSSPWRGCIGLATAKDPKGPWEVKEPALMALLPEGMYKIAFE
eukprot:scaffold9468_cov36-Prasinocladus_malaysianus.AAC.1